MATYSADAALTFPSQNSYANHAAKSRFSDGKSRRKRAFGYVRVSTDMQAQYGLSLEAQKDQIAAYARAYSYEVVGVYVDHDSAKNTHGRPEYLKMVAEVDKGKADFIISTALDRLSRSQRDFLAFQDEYVKTDKVHLVLINQGINTELPASRQFLPLIVAFAQLERERIAERVKGIIGYIRSQGGHFGKGPFGYMAVNDGRLKRLVKHPENFAWLEKMAEWRKEGMTFETIAHRLNEKGVIPAQSPKWTKVSVYDRMTNEKLHVVKSELGDNVYDRERAYNLAYSMRTDGHTLGKIAEKLNKEGLRPPKASAYQWFSVKDLFGSLPLEADIILLHLDKHADITAFAQYFSFLVPSLRPYLLLEFKSPADRLTLADFDTVRAYAMLCKRKYKVADDEEVAVAMLYSRVEADFFDRCARNGYSFTEAQAGVRNCNQHALRFSAVDLVAFGKDHPDHPINLLSARRREFWKTEHPDGLGPFDVLWNGVFLRELRNMSQRQLQGYQELLDDAARTRALAISTGTVEERLRGLSPEERLRGIAPEEMLRHLSATERARLRQLLLSQDQAEPTAKPRKK